jgi:hypothetical protein
MILNAINSLIMKELKITSDWIDRYNEDELDAPERDFFQQRMLQNPLLRTEVRLDAQLNRFLRDKDILDLMKKVQSVTRKANRSSGLMNYLLIAASVLFMIMAGSIYYLVEIKPVSHQTGVRQQVAHSPKKQVPGHADKGKQDVKPVTEVNPMPREISGSNLLAENFKPMAEFERLVGSVTRSGQIRLATPAARTKIEAGIPVRFSWISGNTRQPVTIVLMNNRGKLVFESPSLYAASMVIETKGLPKGLYYWKIMYIDELVMIGKITLY